MKKIIALILGILCVVMTSVVYAAPVGKLRTSISPARVRIVLDSQVPIEYKVEKKELKLELDLPQSSSQRQHVELKDTSIKNVILQPKGKASKLTINLAKDCQYKVYRLEGPNRLVIDVFRINIITQNKTLANGVTYSYRQDEFNGKQVHAFVLALSKDALCELRPFSAAGAYNGRGLLTTAAAGNGALAAINTSYFDTDGWVIGSTKYGGQFISMDENPRSGLVVLANQSMIIPDLRYKGIVHLPKGKTLQLKGMNRARIADDLVLYNEHYALTTKTNNYGREIKIKNNRVVEVSTKGNMRIEPGCVVVSGHGVNAAALAGVRVGDKVSVSETLGNPLADQAKLVITGGPMLLQNGKVCVRSVEENIPRDIAVGRAPRTAVGVKRDGTILLLVVDGRSFASSGMTLNELAQYFLRLGAINAVNFDGGGSSAMVVDGRLVNKPSDGKERRVSMGLGVFRK